MKARVTTIAITGLAVLFICTLYAWRQAVDRAEIAESQFQELQRKTPDVNALQNALEASIRSLATEYSEKLRANPIPIVCLTPPKQKRMFPFSN